MNISREALRGYMLEELLAYLIRDTGYNLLTDANQDPLELAWRHNGLVVKGRGAVHQVDVLGELSWVPAFTYPLRLFVEAKYRNARTQIGPVRNMVATLLDINQSNMPQTDHEPAERPIPVEVSGLRPKYNYVGAIFSTSGFTRPAQDMAVAHGISLINLDTPDFESLLQAVDASAEAILVATDPSRGSRVGTIPPGRGFPDKLNSRGRYLMLLRSILRRNLGTQSKDYSFHPYPFIEDNLQECLSPAIAAARNIGELFVGMGRGPYMIVLKADDRHAFLKYSRENPNHEV